MRIRSSTQTPTPPPIGGPRLGPTGISSVWVEPVVVGVVDGDAVAAREHTYIHLKIFKLGLVIMGRFNDLINTHFFYLRLLLIAHTHLYAPYPIMLKTVRACCVPLLNMYFRNLVQMGSV